MDSMWRSQTLAELLTLFLIPGLIGISEMLEEQPSFDSPLANVTVKEMATAILPCSVTHQGKHQIVWTDQLSTILTYEDRRIIDDERVSVERPFMKDWNLHIRDVKIKDQGLYSCQINTHPVKIKTVYLTVQVPAKILNNSSTDAVVAREGSTVTLTCNVDGLPIPNVTWYRITTTSKGETKKSEFCPGTNTVGMRGEVLIIHNVSRHCGDTYECWAFNGVPPAISKYIKVSVEFPPEITMPNVAIGQDVGKETILECTITANPQSVGVWKKNGVDIKTQTGRYRIEPYPEAEFTISLGLKIQVIEPEDFGIYTCEATNKVGTDSKEMLLYEYAKHRNQLKAESSTKNTASTTQAPLGTYHTRVSQKAPHYEGYEQEQEERRITKVVKDNQQSGTHKPIGLGVPSTENKGTALIGWLSTCLLCVLVNLSLACDVLFSNGLDITL